MGAKSSLCATETGLKRSVKSVCECFKYRRPPAFREVLGFIMIFRMPMSINESFPTPIPECLSMDTVFQMSLCKSRVFHSASAEVTGIHWAGPLFCGHITGTGIQFAWQFASMKTWAVARTLQNRRPWLQKNTWTEASGSCSPSQSCHHPKVSMGAKHGKPVNLCSKSESHHS